jgi:hypothetical protein
VSCLFLYPGKGFNGHDYSAGAIRKSFYPEYPTRSLWLKREQAGSAQNFCNAHALPVHEAQSAEGAKQPSPDRKVRVWASMMGSPEGRDTTIRGKAPLSSYAQNHIHLVFSTKGRLKTISKGSQPRPAIHHRGKKSFEVEFIALLKKDGVEFDPKYLFLLGVAPFGAHLDYSDVPGPYGPG